MHGARGRKQRIHGSTTRVRGWANWGFVARSMPSFLFAVRICFLLRILLLLANASSSLALGSVRPTPRTCSCSCVLRLTLLRDASKLCWYQFQYLGHWWSPGMVCNVSVAPTELWIVKLYDAQTDDMISRHSSDFNGFFGGEVVTH